MEGRPASQVMYRWTMVLDPSLKKGHWTPDEDEVKTGIDTISIRLWSMFENNGGSTTVLYRG